MAIQGSQLITFEWCMVGTTLGFVCLRLYVRIPSRITRRPSTSTASTLSKPSLPGTSGKASDVEIGRIIPPPSEPKSRWTCPWPISDIFVIFAWLSFVGQAAMDTVLNADGFFESGIDVWNPVESDYKAERALKIYFAENVTYLNCMFAVKAAMLCLYHEFFPKEMKKIRICLWVTDVAVGVSFLAGCLTTLLYCLPLQRNWTRNPMQFCSSLNFTVVIVIAIGSHVLTDIMIYALPIAVVRTLRHRLPRWQRAGIFMTFGAGFFCVFFAVGLLACTYVSASFATYYTFCVFEQMWAIVVACLPSVKFLVASSRWRWIRRMRDEMECGQGYRATHMDLLRDGAERQRGGSVYSKRTVATVQLTGHVEPAELEAVIVKDSGSGMSSSSEERIEAGPSGTNLRRADSRRYSTRTKDITGSSPPKVVLV